MPNEHIFIDSAHNVVCCTHCGETIPIPLGRIAWVSAVMTAYAEAHGDCEPYDDFLANRKAYFQG